MEGLKQNKGLVAHTESPSQPSLSRLTDSWRQSEDSQSWYRRDQETGNLIAVIMQLRFPWMGVLGYWIEAKEWETDSGLRLQGISFDLPSAKVVGELKVEEYLINQAAAKIEI